MESVSRVKLIPKEERESTTTILGANMYTTGKMWASQSWAKKADVKRAQDFFQGKDTYGNKKPLVYRFTNPEGETCYLIGDGHHRAGEALIEGKDLQAQIDADLGTIEQELLDNPRLAAQKFAVLGIEGIWQFREFMRIFTDVRIDLVAKNSPSK